MSTSPGHDLVDRLRAALDPPATDEGGRAVIGAIGSDPPAIAVLATGSVVCAGDELRIAVQRGSSFATAQPRRAATLVVADHVSVLRASIAPLTTESFGSIVVVSGPLVAIRPSVELPWALRLEFTPTDLADRRPFLEYWAATRRWLAGGCHGSPPDPPRSG